MNRIFKTCLFISIMLLSACLASFTSVNELSAQSSEIDWSTLEVISGDNLDRLTNLAHGNSGSSTVSFLTSFYAQGSLLIGAILDHQHVYLLEADPSAVNITALGSYPYPNVRGLTFSEQGNLLGIVSSDQVDVWDLTEDQSSTLPLPTSVFYALEFRPQAGTLMIGAVDRLIEWNLTTNSAIQTFVLPNALVQDISFLPDGNFLAVGFGGGVTLVDWETQQRISLGITSTPNGEVLFSPDGTMLAYRSEVGQEIALWNSSEDNLIQIKELGVGEPGSDLDFSADGQLLWIATSDGVEIYDGVTGDYIDTLDQFSVPVTTVSLTSDGRFLITGHANGDVNIWGVPPAGANIPPTANAGPDQTMTATGDTALVELDGSGSTDPDGAITSYNWSEAETVIATDEISQVELSIGSHELTLTVTDNEGATGSDDITIAVEPPPNLPPTATAGPDQTVIATGDTALVSLDGSGSTDSDGTITSYSWSEAETIIATEAISQVELPVGSHNITLTVVDDDGATGSDDVTIAVEPPSYPFFEDFESGTDKWALTGHWALNGAQFYSGAWSMRNARSTDYTAFTDTLTLIDPLNLNDAVAPYLTYWSRFNLSTNERVQVQVSTDDGASWTTVETYFEVTDLTWKPRRIDLRAYAGQPIRLRFVFVASACESDCVSNKAWWIDDVKVDEFPSAALNEDFEAGTSQWTLTDRWVRASNYYHSPSRAMRVTRGTTTSAFTERLTLNDPLDLGDFTAPLLTYWTRYNVSSYETIRVQVSIDGSGTWTTLQTISNLNNFSQWMRQRIDLSPYSGQLIRLRFVFTSAACSDNCIDNAVWWIDDVTVTEQPAMTFADDFELGIANWTPIGRWGQGTTHHSGSSSIRNLRGSYYDAYNDLMTLNIPLDLTTSDIPVLTFWTRYKTSSFERIQVQVCPVGSTCDIPWNKINQISEYWTDGVWWFHQLDLSAYRGLSINLRFRFYGMACDPATECITNPVWWIDDVQIAELPPSSGDLPFVDYFEEPNTNWTISGGWGGGVDIEDGNNFVRGVASSLNSIQRLVEPLDLSGVRQPKLSFRTRYLFLNNPVHGIVEVSLDGGTQWESLLDLDNANVANWSNREVDLSAYAGRQIELRFRLTTTTSSPSAFWDIDDVVIQEKAP